MRERERERERERKRERKKRGTVLKRALKEWKQGLKSWRVDQFENSRKLKRVQDREKQKKWKSPTARETEFESSRERVSERESREFKKT
jgi:hypothetical protein